MLLDIALSALLLIQLDTRVAALVVKLLLCAHPNSPVESLVPGDVAVSERGGPAIGRRCKGVGLLRGHVALNFLEVEISTK